jgi:glyoxylase-like metal-dependent hydrolase (beta-lactamase superfamily II)
MEEILPNLWRIKIPLPQTPLKYLNSYVIKGPERSLVIDTGLNHDSCLQAMHEGLAAAGVNPQRLDFFITHLHADHFGLVSRLAKASSRVYFNRPEKELIETWEGFEPMIRYAARNGFPEPDLRAALAQHPGRKYASQWIPELQALDDGDEICAGSYRFRCVATPGHTQGHTCLYEAERKVLLAGDHLLIDITPNIQCWSEGQNPLASYMASLDKVSQLDVVQVLPGHRRLFTHFRRRIEELKRHHARRLEEVYAILSSGARTAYEVASRMHWDIDCENWKKFPVAQKWFATGEALAHLHYLEHRGRVRRTVRGQTVVFCPGDATASGGG